MGVSKNQGPHHRPQIVGLLFCRLLAARWDHNHYHTSETIQNLPYINPKTAPIRPTYTMQKDRSARQPPFAPKARSTQTCLVQRLWLLYITHLTRVTANCCSRIVTHDLQKRTCGVSFAPVPEPLQKFMPTCILKRPMSRTMDNETLAHISAVPANMRFQFWLKAAYLQNVRSALGWG